LMKQKSTLNDNEIYHGHFRTAICSAKSSKHYGAKEGVQTELAFVHRSPDPDERCDWLTTVV
jgi:hypothetical protein